MCVEHLKKMLTSVRFNNRVKMVKFEFFFLLFSSSGFKIVIMSRHPR